MTAVYCFSHSLVLVQKPASTEAQSIKAPHYIPPNSRASSVDQRGVMFHDGRNTDFVYQSVVLPQLPLVLKESDGRYNPLFYCGFVSGLIPNRWLKLSLCKSQDKLDNLLTIKMY